jgi:hypothetical protein
VLHLGCRYLERSGFVELLVPNSVVGLLLVPVNWTDPAEPVVLAPASRDLDFDFVTGLNALAPEYQILALENQILDSATVDDDDDAGVDVHVEGGDRDVRFHHGSPYDAVPYDDDNHSHGTWALIHGAGVYHHDLVHRIDHGRYGPPDNDDDVGETLHHSLKVQGTGNEDDDRSASGQSRVAPRPCVVVSESSSQRPFR